MYKVFINDKPIIFTSTKVYQEKYLVKDSKNIDFKLIIKELISSDENGLYIFCENEDVSWQEFLASFKVVSAAGGLVLNPSKDMLFIYRNDRWDLPKGHIEKGEATEEAAIREVEEECGIKNVSIDQFLLKTYHIFLKKDQIRIKETFWYLMFSTYKGKLTPQLEESITEVGFKSEQEISMLFKNTYANIKLVYEAYRQKMNKIV